MRRQTFTILAMSLITATVCAAPSSLTPNGDTEVSWFDIVRDLTCKGSILDGSIFCAPGPVEDWLNVRCQTVS
jgi:hypothetical protein